jgi:AcrR family transcriptional regulator
VGSTKASTAGRRVASERATTRTAILKAGREIFASKAYEDVSLQEIAKAVGVTRTALYHYFPSKRDLAGAILLEDSGEARRWWRDAAAGADSLVEELRAIFTEGVDRALRDPTAARVYFRLAQAGHGDDGAHRTVDGYVADLHGDLKLLLEAARARGELPEATDIRELLDAIMGMMWALALGATIAPDGHVRRQVTRAVDLILNSSPWP